ncbi:sulfatase-like hydrolase/transferase [Candidatus Bathyarchaeota archaeon]|nr:sulfatase-like hydrolase/transferase [Candidatus Bathyarchaeota archaeon]
MLKKPNIVLIMTDTQGANIVGCYGRPEMRTPNIDKLAAEGIRFNKAYTCCPVCGPARASIFTGTYPHTNGVLANNIPLGANIRTIGERLRDNGYHTAYIGKWHLSGTDYFDDGGCPPGWDPKYWYDGRCYLEELTVEERLLWRQKLRTPEDIHKYKITEDFTWAHRCSNRAIEFLKEHSNRSPFFLVVSYDEPHGPSVCPPPFCDMFIDFEYPLGENAQDPLTDKPQHQREWAEYAGLPKDMRSLKNPMYFGCNSFVDYEIGRVLEAVDEYAPDALVIFTSDHGTPLGAHRLNSKGPAMYEEITRIPFIVRWRDHVPRNVVCEYPVSHINIVPTLLEVAGLKVPPFMEGSSILQTLFDPKMKPNEYIFMEFTRYEVNHDSWGGFQPIRCIFDGRYKLVINLLYTDELYDLKSDPQEMRNLIDSQEHAEIRDFLHDRLLEWMDETRDVFRGPVWERRPWKKVRRMGWNGSGKTRPRRDDGYLPRVLLYETGLPVEKWEYDKFSPRRNSLVLRRGLYV